MLDRTDKLERDKENTARMLTKRCTDGAQD